LLLTIQNDLLQVLPILANVNANPGLVNSAQTSGTAGVTPVAPVAVPSSGVNLGTSAGANLSSSLGVNAGANLSQSVGGTTPGTPLPANTAAPGALSTTPTTTAAPGALSANPNATVQSRATGGSGALNTQAGLAAAGLNGAAASGVNADTLSQLAVVQAQVQQLLPNLATLTAAFGGSGVTGATNNGTGTLTNGFTGATNRFAGTTNRFAATNGFGGLTNGFVSTTNRFVTPANSSTTNLTPTGR